MRDLPTARSLALALCVVLGPAVARADVSFTRSDFPVGYESFSMATADLDGDGNLDLVMGNIGGTLTILLGTGTGSFGAPNYLTGHPDALEVTLGDVNGDAIPDIITANRGVGGQTGTTISVWLGHGDGTFAPHVEYSSGGRGPSDVVIGDVNRDGRADLVVANNDDICLHGSIAVLLGNGDGSFGLPTTFFVGCAPNSVTLADFDRDGFVDVGSVLNPFGLMLLRGGDSTFTVGASFPAGPVPAGLESGDLNGDGRVDLVTPNHGAQFGVVNTVTMLLGGGDGTFDTRLPAVTGFDPSDAQVADLDGDGIADLVTTHFEFVPPGGPSVLIGNGDGTFGAATSYPAPAGFSRALEIGDFDGDGRNDFAIERGPALTVSVYRNVSGSPTHRIHVTAGAHGLVAPLGTPLGIVTVPAGGSRSFSMTPDLGYVINDVIVDGASVGAISSYTFDGVAADHTIQASFQALPPVIVEFELFHKKIQLGKPSLIAKTVEARIEPPPPLMPADIDVASLRFAGTVPISVLDPTTGVDDRDHDGLPELIVQIDRFALEPVLPTGDAVPVEVSGKIAGRDLVGTDVVQVTRPKVMHPDSTTSVHVGSVIAVQYEVAPAVFEYAALLSSFDGGATWSWDGVHHANTGEIPWLAPNQPVTRAQLAIVQVESEGDPVTDVTGVLSVSEPFSIEGVLGAELPVARLEFRAVAPTPSRGRAAFRFALPAPGRVDLDVFDASGRRIRRLTDGVLSSGAHTIEWRGNDGRGSRVPAGVYQARLRYQGQELRQRVVWLNE